MRKICHGSHPAKNGSYSVPVDFRSERTVRGSEESRSWQVFYIPKVLEAAGSASPDVFPRLSSPTDETLVPGRYVMWVRQPDTNRTSERIVVKVGEGKGELLLDLTVPADPAR